MITSGPAFADYFDGVRRRTRDFVEAVPASASTGRPGPASTPAATSCATSPPPRRCSSAPSWAAAGTIPATSGRWRRRWPPRWPASTPATPQAGAQLRGLPDGALGETRPALEPGARPVRAWRLLLAMVEHEVHHRSQLASYLTWMGLEAPDIFGLGVEDVERLTADAAGRG